MNSGKLQQYGTSKEIYDHPSNRFVAEFIGSPPMNFIDCSMVEKDDEIYLDQGTFMVNVTTFRSVLKDLSSPEVTLGARPEDVKIFHKSPSKTAVKVCVFAYEPVGTESIIDVMVGGDTIRITAPDTFIAKPGDEKFIDFDLSKVHIIDGKTEKVIV